MATTGGVTPVCYTTVEAIGSSQFTTTTVIEPSSAASDGPQDPVPLRDVITRNPTMSDGEWDRLINAFLLSEPPAIWIDCQEAEVLTVETYQSKAVPFLTSGMSVADEPFDDPSQKLTLETIQTAFDVQGTDVAPGPHCALAQCYHKKVVTVPCSGVRPTRIPLTACQPVVRAQFQSDKPIIVSRIWGWITADPVSTSLVTTTVAGVSTTTTVFRTIGKIIKVVSQVAGIVLPLLEQVFGRDGRPTDIGELRPLERRMVEHMMTRKRPGKSQKRKAPKRLGPAKKPKAARKN